MLYSLSEFILVFIVLQSSLHELDVKSTINLYYLKLIMEHISNNGFVTEGPVLTVLSLVTQEIHLRLLNKGDSSQRLQ